MSFSPFPFFRRFDWNSFAHIDGTDWIRATFQPTDYTPLTWRTIPRANIWLVAYFVMAYLTRRPGTYLLRLLLLPLTILLIIQCTTHYRIENPVFGWYNWIRGKRLMALAAVAKATHFAVVPQGTLKIGEERLGCSDKTSGSVASPGEIPNDRWLPAGIRDALEVGIAARGIGWKFAEGVHIPMPRRPLERNAYLKRTSISVVRTYLLVDFFDSFLETLPGITVNSGTIFFPSLPVATRYLVSTALHLGTGIVVILGLEMWYDIASLVGVGLLRQPPAIWPPMHDEPWHMKSLHEFWSRQWHQLLRDTFLVMGGYPGRWIAGDLGLLFGTFLASGLFHEVGLYLGGAPIGPRVLIFFVAQAFGVLIEKLYKSLTGRRVEGWIGAAWVAIFVLGLGQLCTDSWVSRGAGGRALVPPTLSPARRILFPGIWYIWLLLSSR
ncbi:hypothetical protein GY45DRAFT_1393759 [Cubamyces sp. BRFM 1775]|nr:hypothetical protein GY45DRAFT_1393759 [Cubamyces sp. BRFM 1775]